MRQAFIILFEFNSKLVHGRLAVHGFAGWYAMNTARCVKCTPARMYEATHACTLAHLHTQMSNCRTLTVAGQITQAI